jgi:hypothetical protein
VRADAPFTLTAAAIDTSSVTVSAPEIGLTPTQVPNTVSPPMKAGQTPSTAGIAKLRLDLGPVPKGTYQLRVVTGGKVRSVPLIAE